MQTQDLRKSISTIIIFHHSINNPSIWKEYIVTVFFPKPLFTPTPKLTYNCSRNQTYNVPHLPVLWLKGTFAYFAAPFFFSQTISQITCLIFFLLSQPFFHFYWIFPIQTNAINKEQRREHNSSTGLLQQKARVCCDG